jgi:phosphoserine phosphatase
MRTAVFFCLEGPVVRGELPFSFLLWAGLRGRLRAAEIRRGLLNYLRHRGSVVRAAEGPGADGITLLRGCGVARVESAAAAFFTARLALRIRPQAAAFVAAHRRRGHVTILLTPAATVLARPLARFLGVDVLLAPQLEVTGLVYTGRSLTPQPCGATKRLVAQDYCAQFGSLMAYSYAYASALADSPLLEAVGHPTAVHPDRALRARAARRGWPIAAWDAAAANLTP